MNYYEIAVLKSPLTPLTYQSEESLALGSVVEITIQNRKKIQLGIVVKEVEKPDFKCKDISAKSTLYLDKNMLEVAKFVSTYYVCSLGHALSLFTAYERDKEFEKKEPSLDGDVELSKAQNEAYEFTNKHNSSLLFANTGSGKTEIYIKAMLDQAKESKQSLFLLPEISLTPQMEKRLKKIFGEAIAIWHSKVTKKKKEQIVSGIQSGEIKVVAGARSALFLPFDDLGLIVVDEEHDDSYKSEQTPRYNAKDLSLFIGKKFGIKVILGSATPSLSSYNKIPFYRLKETYFETKKFFVFDESKLGINEDIYNRIKATVDSGHQVIIFLPTRANFKYQVCSDCGKAVECPYCSVSMSLHKNSRALKCHYCNYTQAIPEVCPSCNIGVVKNFRIGTAEVEENLKYNFKDNVVKRFDRDEISTQRKLEAILKEFNSGDIDILVGTQMLSKGHDYHNVKLAIILGIDSIVNMPSYKSREKALSLLLQIAGRSGRSGFGEVLIQSQSREFFEEYLDDYERFLKDELEFREGMYPPFTRLAKATFSHTNGLKAKEEMERYFNHLKEIEDIQILSANEATIFKVANKYRYEILFRSTNVNRLINVLHSIDSPFVTVDMDTNY